MDDISKTLSEQLEWRYATKRFDPAKKISPEDFELLRKAIILAPTSYGLQPWKAIVVEDAGLRRQLRAESWDQPQIEEASHILVFAALKNLTEGYIKRYIQKIADVRSVTTESLQGYENMMTGNLINSPKAAHIESWAQRQTYIALGFLLEAAALKSIDACPMEGFDPVKYDELLGLTNSEYGSVVVAALGYRSAEDKAAGYKKVRLEPDELFSTR